MLNNTRKINPYTTGPNKISRVDYSKHPHARIISVGVGIAALVALYIWAFSAVG